jgi:soluble lytic murein transglycosylase-like protein
MTVSRLLTKRKHFTPIFLVLLAFPAAALAATGTDGAPSGPRVGPARPLPDPAPVDSLRRSAQGFDHLVQTISHRIEVEEIAAARRAEREKRERLENLPGGVSLATLEAIASCESGGDPTAVSSDGSYRGKYQFDYGTWESVGGSGDPAAAPEVEQDYRAALLYSRAGSSPWPVCG